jgi:monoamine oxidase
MAHTNVMHLLRRLAREFGTAERDGRPVDEVHGEQAEARLLARRQGISRRSFLAGAGALAAATALPIGLAYGKKPGGGGGSSVKVAIIGGGMAGLAAALRLRDSGVVATVYEGQGRVGGRLLTERSGSTSCGLCHAPRGVVSTAWADNQYVDVFGELIDNPGYWTRVWYLAERFGLATIDMWASQPDGATDTLWFNGGYYPWSQVIEDFKPVYAAVSEDARLAKYPTLWNKSTAAGRALDNMSVHDWIASRVPGGHASRMGKFLDVNYAIEYGADTQLQSALNLVYLLAYQPKPVTFSVFGESDERYKLAGGIDGLTTAMANHLGWDTINLGWFLKSIAKGSDGRYTLTFDAGRTVTAEVVLLALPFSAMRANIDFSRAGFDNLKTRAIREQGAAHNLKMALQFTRRFWNEPGPWGVSNGNLAADNGMQYGWDGTRGVPGTHGLMINYTGGSVTDAQALKHPYGNAGDAGVRQDAEAFLAQLEQVFPGCRQYWNGKVCSTKAHLDPHYLSSYGNYLPGQYQLMCGYERVRQGNVFFAGEHTSVDYFGFFEGAAVEGWSAAEQILATIGVASAPLEEPRRIQVA